MTQNIRLTPLFVGKCLSSQIHDWSGNGGGNVPYPYRTKSVRKILKNPENLRISKIVKSELLIRNKFKL